MMEAAVYADAAARHAISVIDSIELQRDIPAWDYEGTAVPEEMALITQDYKEMQQIMTNYVGIVRSDVRPRAGQAAARDHLQGDRGAIPEVHAEPASVRAAQHDRRRLPDHQAGRGAPRERRPALLDRLSGQTGRNLTISTDDPMKTRFALIASLCLLAGCSAQGPDNRTADLRGKRVLVFTGHGEGYVHENIAASAAMILELAAQEDFAADTTSDKRVFCDDSLERYDAIVYANASYVGSTPRSGRPSSASSGAEEDSPGCTQRPAPTTTGPGSRG